MAKPNNPYAVQLALEKERRRRKGLNTELEPLWKPFPDVGGKPHPQRLATESLADETLFGGQPGGGKTDWLIGMAVTQHRNSAIFRRELSQMKGKDGIIARSQEIIGNRGVYNATEHTWKKIDGYRDIEFLGVKNPSDVNKFKGRAHSLKAFDEVSEFTEEMYQFLIGWNRSPDPNERCRVICTSNPPTTVEGQWVTRRWAAWLDEKHPNPAKPGELRWYAIINGRDTEVESDKEFVLVDGKITYDFDRRKYRAQDIIKPKSRTFIPSSVTDNPVLMASGYISTLQRLPEPLRTIMLNPEKGWNMSIKDDLFQVIPTAHVLAAIERGKTTPKPKVPLTALGVDPSLGGEDSFVIAKRYANWYDKLQVHAGVDVPTGQVGAAIVLENVDPGTDPDVNIDIIGIGATTYDFLLESNLGFVNPINFAEASSELDNSGKYRLANVRAAAYWQFREALDPERGQNICLPDDDILKADLCAPRYRITARGILIESKDEIRDRIGRSPDRGDAVVLANYTGEQEMDAGMVYTGETKR